MTEDSQAIAVTTTAQDSPVRFGDGRRTDRLEHLDLQLKGYAIPASIKNIATVLDGLSEWAGVLAYNELADQIIVLRPIPGSSGNPNLHKPRPLQDSDLTKARMWLETRLNWSKVSKNDTFDAIDAVARENVIAPVRHYLESLEVMEVQEATDFLAEVLNAHFGLRRFNEHPDTIRFSAIAFRKWLISAVARAFEPGCKADHVLILEGGQGAGKSTAVRILCGDDVFGDSIPSLHTKDAMDYVRGKWIIELDELSSVSKAEVEHVKAFVTRTEEKFRPPYGRTEVSYQRRCVFVGTTNRSDYLRDETGNRRFWPVRVDKIDLDLIRCDRDRIWAAAVTLYRHGEQWWLTPEEAALAATEQSKRTTIDPLHEEVEQWLRELGWPETCMAAAARQFMPVDEGVASARLTPQQQHRLRGALFAAGYESLGKRFTSGEFKGQTRFARVVTEPE